MDDVVPAAEKLLAEREQLQGISRILDLQMQKMNIKKQKQIFERSMGIKLLTLLLHNSNLDTMRELADSFRQDFSSGIAIIANDDEFRDIFN